MKQGSAQVDIEIDGDCYEFYFTYSVTTVKYGADADKRRFIMMNDYEWDVKTLVVNGEPIIDKEEIEKLEPKIQIAKEKMITELEDAE